MIHFGASRSAGVARTRDNGAGAPTWLSRNGDEFSLCGQPMNLETEPEQVRADVAAWLAMFRNYEQGFVGDVPRLQRDYFTFMAWFYFAPLMCDIRNAAIRSNAFNFDQSLFALLYGSSSSGKSCLLETITTSMFGYPRSVDKAHFTAARVRGLQRAYRRFPVVFDDVARKRFGEHADEVIKDESIPCAEYPCFALSMNAETRSFRREITRRCLMIDTRASLRGDDPLTNRALKQSGRQNQARMTTSLFRLYLSRIAPRVDREIEQHALQEDSQLRDVLELSSTALCELIEGHLPQGTTRPQWCSPMTIDECQQRALDRPRRILEHLLGADRYSGERRPPEGCWTCDGETLRLAINTMELSRTKADIPDWLLDDTRSSAGQITLDRKLTEELLARPIRAPSRWARWTR